MTIKGFRAEILTGPHHAPNGGLSATAQYVTIIGDAVPQELHIWTPDDAAPAVRLDAFPFRRLVPATTPQDFTGVGPMASGAFAHSDDSRWTAFTGGSGPIPLHDRYESIELCNALSSD